ncbi:MAG TPA: accessory factor UbiK family protein [Caulobacterales bacterium]|nr:accessory factor UbiK family protein [Caulobacterales bacterium]
MQTQSPIFDDLAKAMTGAMGMAAGLTEEAKSLFRAQAARLVAEMDLVGRDEFEAIKQLAAETRAENETLKARLAAVEEKLGKRA